MKSSDASNSCLATDFRWARRGILFALLAMILKSPAHAETPEELAKFIFEQNDEARLKLDKISFKFTEQFSVQGGTKLDHPIVINGEYKQAAPQSWGHISQKTQTTDDPASIKVDTTVLYVGERTSGRWDVGTINPNGFEHADVAEPSRREHALVYSQLQASSLWAGFGTESSSASQFKEQMKLSEACSLRWHAERIKNNDGHELYLVKRFSKAHRGPEPDLLCWFDPNAGFLLTRMQFRTSGENLVDETTVTPAMDENSKIWYPAAVEQTRYLPGGGVSAASSFKVDEIRFDPEFGPKQFTADSLGLPNGAKLLRLSADETIVTTLKQTEDGLKVISRQPMHRAADSPVPAGL